MSHLRITADTAARLDAPTRTGTRHATKKKPTSQSATVTRLGSSRAMDARRTPPTSVVGGMSTPTLASTQVGTKQTTRNHRATPTFG